MLSNHIKSAFRSLIKQKVFSAINLFGLTVGLIAFLLISLYLFDELTYDRFHKKADDIYRVIETRTTPEGKETKVVSVAANISNRLKKDFPEVENATRFSMLGRSNVSNPENTNVFYESYYLGDSSFFSVFDFPRVDGVLKTALNQPYSVVITKETAIKYFGRTAVTGKTLQVEGDSIPYTVTAVVAIPDNSHLKFNCLFSEATLYSIQNYADVFVNDWTSNNFITYVILKDKLAKRTASSINTLVNANRRGDALTKSSFTLQPLKDIHFKSAGLEGNTDNGNITNIYVFELVAAFVLLIACINYMNLTTARFAGRSKEIAVRKVSGATRQHLISQFLTEAMLITFCSLIIAIGVVKLILPIFNSFTEKQLTLDINSDYRIFLILGGTAFLAGLISGLYPALFQSRLKPWLLLRKKVALNKSNLSVRQALVIFQFSLSIIMIVATMVVYQQMKYMDTADMGFNKEQLLVVDINSGSVRRTAQAIKTEFSRIPGVKSVSVTSRVPGEWKVIPKVKVKVPGRFSTEGEDVYYIAADDQFLKTFEVKLLNGRNFSSSGGDSAAIILNETAAKMMGISTPSEQLIEIPSAAFSGNAYALRQTFNARVIGIVQDFNFQSLRDKVAPMVIGYQQNPVHNIDYFTSKISNRNIEGTLKSMEDVLRRVDASHLFEYNFLDKKWELFYRQDQRRQTIFFCMALLTILIASLGLFGLATYAAEQRIKEIGIRKVLGASVGSIVAMLSKDFTKLVLIASIIAIPVSWWAMHKWLNDFAYRITVHWWVFLLAAVAALMVALVTVSFQAIKAAIVNPVKSLRTE